jgi:hypothetical protein
MTEEELNEKIKEYIQQHLTVTVNFFGSTSNLIRANVILCLNGEQISYSSGGLSIDKKEKE